MKGLKFRVSLLQGLGSGFQGSGFQAYRPEAAQLAARSPEHSRTLSWLLTPTRP